MNDVMRRTSIPEYYLYVIGADKLCIGMMEIKHGVLRFKTDRLDILKTKAMEYIDFLELRDSLEKFYPGWDYCITSSVADLSSNIAVYSFLCGIAEMQTFVGND